MATQSGPIAPSMAVGLSTVVRGISARKEIARNLDVIEDAIHAGARYIPALPGDPGEAWETIKAELWGED